MLVAVVLIASVAVPGTAGAQFDEPETTKGHSRPIYTNTVTDEYRIPTEHGTLYGIVQRPVVPEGVKVPIILTYSPYNIIRRTPNGPPNLLIDGTAKYYVPRGYARAQFDLVGHRESSGCPDFGGIAERETGAAVVDFLGSREWSNGKVGMIGGSYDGTTQYATAVEAPEHLTTIVPQVAIDRWYDYPYEHGVRRYSGFGTPLLFDFGFGFIPPLDVRDPGHFAEASVDRVSPCERVQNQIEGYGYDPVYDDFWDERDYRAMAHQVKASVLIEGGWLDSNVQPVGSTRFFNALPEDHPKKLVMGQWGHSAPTLSDWNDVRHAWFDYWLLGYDGHDDDDDLPNTGVMDLPRVDSEVNGRVRFQDHSWPPAGTQSVDLPLTADPAAGALALDNTDQPSFTATDPTLSTRDVANGNCDGTCLVFLGEPLETEVRLSGTPTLHLKAVSTSVTASIGQLATQYGAVLFMQTTDGRRTVIANGMLNARNRNGLRVNEALTPGEEYSATVEIDDLDYLVPPGARLGVAIASHFENVAFLPDNDAPARNTVVLDELEPTVLRLPASAGAAALRRP